MLTYFLKAKSTDLTTLSFGSRTFTRRGIIILPVVLVHKGRLFCFLISHYHPGICRFFRMSQPQCTFRPENTSFPRTENCSSFIARRQWIARFIDVVCQFCCEWILFGYCRQWNAGFIDYAWINKLFQPSFSVDPYFAALSLSKRFLLSGSALYPLTGLR